MSFGGSVSAMISSLKNNKSKKHVNIFEKGKRSLRSGSVKLISDKKADPKLLLQIRKKMQRERAKRSVLIFAASALTVFLLYFVADYFIL